MNFKELKEIIDIVTSKESIEELEIEKSGVRLKIKRAIGLVIPSISSVLVSSASIAWPRGLGGRLANSGSSAGSGRGSLS